MIYSKQSYNSQVIHSFSIALLSYHAKTARFSFSNILSVAKPRPFHRDAHPTLCGLHNPQLCRFCLNRFLIPMVG